MNNTETITNEILQLLKTLSKPFDNGFGEKEQTILKILHEPIYQSRYYRDIGIVVPALEEKKIVVISHIDLIYRFNEGFKKDHYFRKDLLNGKEIVVGALDNGITNAIAILMLKHFRSNDICKHVEFVFTEGEETTSYGIKNYISKFGGKNVLFVNLDVTNEFTDKDVSIEYDKPQKKIVEQIYSILKDAEYGFTKERFADDINGVLDSKCNGFSFCIPTFETIHSYKNYTYVDKIAPYYEALYKFLLEVKV